MAFQGQQMGHLGLTPLRARRGPPGSHLQLLQLQLRNRLGGSDLHGHLERPGKTWKPPGEEEGNIPGNTWFMGFMYRFMLQEWIIYLWNQSYQQTLKRQRNPATGNLHGCVYDSLLTAGDAFQRMKPVGWGEDINFNNNDESW